MTHGTAWNRNLLLVSLVIVSERMIINITVPLLQCFRLGGSHLSLG